MNKKLNALILAILLTLTCFQSKADTLSDMTEGYIGSYRATISYTMDFNRKTVGGYITFNSSNAPVKGKINFNGSFKHVKISDVPYYPLYKATLPCKTSSGQQCGTLNIEIDTRMGTVEGKCTLNGKSYKVDFESM